MAINFDQAAAAQALEAACIAYEAEPGVRAHYGAGFVRCFSLPPPKTFSDIRLDTQSFLACVGDDLILAFRGTEPPNLRDWITDIDFAPVLRPVGSMPQVRVHRGFIEALEKGWDEIAAEVARALRPGRRLLITGHSLGGVLASLAAAKLTLWSQPATPVGSVYTFGAPPAGDHAFADLANAAVGDRAYRVVNNNDIVPRLLLSQDSVVMQWANVFDGLGKIVATKLGPIADRLGARLPADKFSEPIDANVVQQFLQRVVAMQEQWRKFGYKHFGQFVYFDHRGSVSGEPTPWHRLRDGVVGRLDNPAHFLADGIVDHFQKSYLRAVAPNSALLGGPKPQAAP